MGAYGGVFLWVIKDSDEKIWNLRKKYRRSYAVLFLRGRGRAELSG
jgi:hypothetical protein